MSARIGLYGGTFNPIHLGHLRAAQEVAEALDLEQMRFVPSARPPHKNPEGDQIAPAELRLEWVRRAIEDNPLFAVDSAEVERHGLSYTIDTLRELARQTAPRPPLFVIGQDAFVEMGTWREPEAIFALADLAVTTRPPVRAGNLAEWLPGCVKDQIAVQPDGRGGRHVDTGTRIHVLEISALEISSSDIRERLHAGRSTRYLLPESVREAIEQSGVFDGSGPASNRPAEDGPTIGDPGIRVGEAGRKAT